MGHIIKSLFGSRPAFWHFGALNLALGPRPHYQGFWHCKHVCKFIGDLYVLYSQFKAISKNMVYKHSKYGQLGVPNPIETFRLITKVWIGYQLTIIVCHKALPPAWQKASSIVWVLKFWANYLNIFYADFNKNISYLF